MLATTLEISSYKEAFFFFWKHYGIEYWALYGKKADLYHNKVMQTCEGDLATPFATVLIAGTDLANVLV